LSARDVALHGTEAGRSKTSFGIEDYKPRLVNFKVHGVSFNKDNETSFIETEANYRKAFPGVGQYQTYAEKDWAEQNAKRNRMKFHKAIRTTVADEQIKIAKKIPGVGAYNIDPDYLKPVPECGHSSIRSKTKRITVVQAAIDHAKLIPAPYPSVNLERIRKVHGRFFWKK